MKKILVIGYSNNRGGVETYIKNVFQNISKKDLEFHFTTIEPTGENYSELLEDGAKIHNVILSRHNYIKYYLFWINFFKKNKFDILYFNTCDIVSIDVLKFAKKGNVPIRIVHSHSSKDVTDNNILHKIEEKISRHNIDKYATHFWACSDSSGQFMFDGRKYEIIKNGINLENFNFNEDLRKKKRHELGIEDGEKAMVFIGRMKEVKDPFKAYEICKHYFEITENIKMFFVGDGVLLDTIQDKIISEKLDNVFAIGPRNDVAEILMASDVLLMTSKFEGLPFVLVEAQATGLPCVVIDNVSFESKITDLVEFVENDADLDVWASNIDFALSRKINREDYSTIVANEGFDIRNTAKMIEDFIKDNVYEKNN